MLQPSPFHVLRLFISEVMLFVVRIHENFFVDIGMKTVFEES